MSQKAKAEKGKAIAQIQFYASLPPIQSALKISGDGDNLRVQLDIPIRISPDGLKLALFTQKRLLVTVIELPENDERPIPRKRITKYPTYAKASETKA